MQWYKMKYIREMLEFNEIIHRLKSYCVTDVAKDNFEQLKPMLVESELRIRMKETTEARMLLDVHGTPPLGTVSKLREIVEGAEKGELLSIDELEKVSQFAILSMRIIRYLNKSEDRNLKISEYGKGMMDLEILKEEIERCIRNGRIDDYATKELKEIRRKIESTTLNIRTKLEGILRSKKEYFSESFVSNRNGHYTLPVKKEYKLQVSGSVIDTSSSGATYFIEPTVVAKLKEQLNELQIAESNEERKVLYILSTSVGDFKSEILLNLDYVEELDYIFAKAKLSLEMKGSEPHINTSGYIRLVNGRHPLLNRNHCVPLTMEFGREIKGIVITGPNTGGKTVALKTVGLCSVMAQCGLHIPCEDADISMTSQVLCDIGDGQSITENLSTFSAHIKNIIDIIKLVDKDSLVLMDELGSGTDPTEGMGIAIAILDELKNSKCNFIATTHYPEVKEYAEQEDTIINARMAFDKESLKPLYVLEMGEAGESCALYIAKQLGMPGSMLKRAYEATYLKSSYKKEADLDILAVEEQVSQVPIGGQKIIKKEEPKQTNQRASKFQIGDSVMVYPQKKLGIVFQVADEKGEVGVQIQKNKTFINHKRLQLKASAKDLYPEDYDFSIIFDSVENRKARHIMNKKHVPGLVIKHEKL
jgi:dsDNA-specific endonuclease/ATPase MutS2